MISAMISKLIQKAERSEHGFKEIQKESEDIVRKLPADEAFQIAKALYSSKVHQARMMAAFIFGAFTARSRDSLGILRKQVSQDENWRVQEILAKAFDRYCADTGYEKALPMIRSWLKDKNPNVRRAVSEGLRIWTNRDYFEDRPKVAVHLLAGLKDDASEYVRTSAGNALRDISKKHPTIVKNELAAWDLADKKIFLTYKLAGRLIGKR